MDDFSIRTVEQIAASSEIEALGRIDRTFQSHLQLCSRKLLGLRASKTATAALIAAAPAIKFPVNRPDCHTRADRLALRPDALRPSCRIPGRGTMRDNVPSRAVRSPPSLPAWTPLLVPSLSRLRFERLTESAVLSFGLWARLKLAGVAHIRRRLRPVEPPTSQRFGHARPAL